MSATHSIHCTHAANSGQGTPLSHASAAGFQAGAGSFSVGCLVKFGTGALSLGQSQSLISKFDSAVEYVLFWNSGSGRFAWATQAGATTYETDGFPGATEGPWYFVVATWNAATGKIELFVNAASVAGPTTATQPDNGSGAFVLGNTTGFGNNTGLEGWLGMAFKFSHALTGPEITWLYNGGFGRSTAEVLAHSGLTGPDVLYGFDGASPYGTDSGANALTLAAEFATPPTTAAGPGSGQPTTAVITGPTALTEGTLSSDYTFTLPGPAVGSIDLTPSFTGFSATTSGGPAVTLATGTASVSFAITPTSAGSGTVSAGSPGITVTPQSGVTSASTLAAGTVTAGSTTTNTAAATATEATGGTGPYTHQWFRSLASGVLGSTLSGQTATTLADTGLTPGTTYYYTLRYTDDASAQADSNQVAETTGSTAATAFTLTAPSPATGPRGRPSGSFTVTPTGTTTGTFTPTPIAGVTFTPAALSWSGVGGPKTFTATQSGTGAITVNGTFSNGLTPPASVTYTFVTPTLSASPSSLPSFATTTVTLTGTATTWTLGAPSITATGVVGVSVGPVSVIDNTHCTVPVTTAGSTGTVLLADGTDVAATTLTVTGAPVAGQLQLYRAAPLLGTVYFVLTAAPGTAWNGSGFEALAAGRWNFYALPAADSGGTGIYTANFPATVPPGLVTAYGYLRLGSVPAATDTLIGSETAPWDGRTFGPGSGSGGLTLAELQAALGTAFVAELSRGASGASVFTLASDSGTDVVDKVIYVLDGPAKDSSRLIVGIDPATKVVTVEPPWSVTPTAPAHYELLATIPDDGSGSGTAVGLDSGSVAGTPRPPTSSTFHAGADGLSPTSRAYDGMSLRFRDGLHRNVRRGIVSYIVTGGVPYFILAGSFPTPPDAGDLFVIE